MPRAKKTQSGPAILPPCATSREPTGPWAPTWVPTAPWAPSVQSASSTAAKHRLAASTATSSSQAPAEGQWRDASHAPATDLAPTAKRSSWTRSAATAWVVRSCEEKRDGADRQRSH